MNALTLAATFGTLILIFQDGRFESLLGYTSQGALDLTIPLVLAALVFAISTDYGVFLLSRIREAQRAAERARRDQRQRRHGRPHRHCRRRSSSPSRSASSARRTSSSSRSSASAPPSPCSPTLCSSAVCFPPGRPSSAARPPDLVATAGAGPTSSADRQVRRRPAAAGRTSPAGVREGLRRRGGSPGAC